MDDWEKFYNITLRFLSYRPRSEKEIKDFLTRKKVEPQVVEKIIAKLKEQKFLDDEEFAKWWIEQRTKARPKGLRLIILELKQKGIAKDLIDRVVESSELRAESEIERAKQLVGKKIQQYRGLPKQEQFQKLGTFLLRRGFDYETAKRTIDEILKNEV